VDVNPFEGHSLNTSYKDYCNRRYRDVVNDTYAAGALGLQPDRQHEGKEPDSAVTLQLNVFEETLPR
jgi:hypothetical protein